MPVTNAKSGVAQYILNNLRVIDRERFAFDFATRSPSLDFAGQVEALGSRVHYLSCSSHEDEKKFVQEMEAILDVGYDAVHLHTSYWNGFLVEKMAMRRKVPRVIIHSHSTMADIADANRRRIALELHERLKNDFTPDLATDFCACSRAAADWLFNDRIPRERIRILPNAINVEAFSFKPAVRERMRRELNLEESTVLGHIGRFTYSKNHTFLLDVLEGLRGYPPSFKLLLVGDGELEAAIRNEAVRRGLAEQVIFLGRRDDVDDVLQAIDLYLHPSRFEGLGLTLIEAQTSGLPCLASEHIPPESKITQDLHFLRLNSALWIEAVEKAARTHVRKDCSELVKKSGFSIVESVGTLEKIYSEAVS